MDAAKAARSFDEANNFVRGETVDKDSFYTPPLYSENDKPGKVLKVEDVAQEKDYFLPQAITISRLMYLSQTLAGNVVPVTACVLWPYSPRTDADGKFQVVAWAHGTSGLVTDYAPSHLKNLWQHFQGPFQIVLHGYVVVATDYAGLGVQHDQSGKRLIHPYLALPAQANDVIFAVQAAHTAFAPQLSRQYVAIGHSQGGGTIWAVAEKQDEGCLGCVALSPVTHVLREVEPLGNLIFAAMCKGFQDNYPQVDLDEVLTAAGKEELEAVYETTKTSVAGTLAILQGGEPLVSGWENHTAVQEYIQRVAVANNPIRCPLLVIHGTDDVVLHQDAVKAAVKQAKSRFPEAKIELVLLPGISHNPALPASQRLWIDWIDKRFKGESVTVQTVENPTELKPPKSLDRYATAQTWYLATATEFYHAP